MANRPSVTDARRGEQLMPDDSGPARAPSMLPTTVACLLIFASLSLASEVRASPWFAVITLITLCLYFVQLFRNNQKLFFLALPLIAVLLPVAASGVYIEFGHYISEEGITGTATGATSRLAIYIVLFFAGIQIATRTISRTSESVPNPRTDETYRAVVRRFTLFANLAYAGTLLISFWVLAKYGVPLLEGVDRFRYWAAIPDVLNRLPFLIAMVSSTTSMSMVLRRRFDAVSVTLLCAGVGTLLLFSEKFTGLFQALTFTLAVCYVAQILHNHRRARLGKIVIGSMVAISVLLSIAAAGYIVFYDYTASDVLAKLMDRALALQGHVWWGIDRVLSQSGPTGNIADLIPDPSNPAHGGWGMLMYAISPASFVSAVIAQGVRFTMGGQALFAYVFGYPVGALLQVVAGIITGFALLYLYYAIKRLNLIAVLMALFGIRVVMNAFLVGDFSDLWKPLALIFWTWLIFDLVHYTLSQRIRRQRRREHLIGSPQ